MKKIHVIFFTWQRPTGTTIIVALAAALRILPLKPLGTMISRQTFNSSVMLNSLYVVVWSKLLLSDQVCVINNRKCFFIFPPLSLILLNVVALLMFIADGFKLAIIIEAMHRTKTKLLEVKRILQITEQIY